MKTNKYRFPTRWRLLKISDCCTIRHGKPQHAVVDKHGKYPVLASGGEIGKTNKFLYNKPSVLIGRKGTIDKPKYIDSPFWTVDTLFYTEIFEYIYPKFLYYLFSRINWKRYNEGSTIPSLTASSISSIKILVPPIEEQKRIAEVLSTWDEGIENLEKLIALKEKQKRALMQRLLTGKTRLKGFSTPWKKVKLGDIGVFSSAGVDKKIIEGELSVHLLNYMDVYRNDFIFSKTLKQEVTATLHKKENCNIKRGDVFFTPSSETREDIGHSAVATTDIKDGVYSYHIVRLRPTQDIDLNFSAYIFKTSLFYKQVYTICEGSGQRYVISLEDFRKLVIKIPSSVDEQIEIGNILTTVDNEISQLKNKLEVFKKQKKYLMQQLLTGKKRLA